MSLDKILDLAVTIQQIPAPTFHEEERAQFVSRLFEKEGLSGISIDDAKNVYACLPGGDAPPLVVSAHTDTVFPFDTDLTSSRSDDGEEIYGPGIGDNSLAVAGLFGLVWALRTRKEPLPGDIWLVANSAEEGLGDLNGMRKVVERFGDTPLAYLVLEGMALGHIYHRALGVRRYRITARTQGGHSWVNYGRPSAIHELARLVTRFTEIEISDNPAASLNVGVIEGGTSINTIAPAASLQLDLRSENPATLSRLVSSVETLVREAGTEEVTYSMEQIGDRPAGEISSEHVLVRLAFQALKKQRIEPSLNIGSTDANIPISQGLPAICIGLTRGSGAHTTGEYILTNPLKQGMAQLLYIVKNAWTISP